jgi:hypothetical protein
MLHPQGVARLLMPGVGVRRRHGVERRAIVVGGWFEIKLTCLSGPAPTVEPGAISTVGPERHGKLVQYQSIGTRLST